MLLVSVRFHQYYCSGQKTDCSHWKESFEDSQKWMEDADQEVWLGGGGELCLVE